MSLRHKQMVFLSTFMIVLIEGLNAFWLLLLSPINPGYVLPTLAVLPTAAPHLISSADALPDVPVSLDTTRVQQ
jgi:hypothetical protein